MTAASRLSSRICWALGLPLAAWPVPALASPFARHVQEATQSPRDPTGPTAVPGQADAAPTTPVSNPSSGPTPAVAASTMSPVTSPATSPTTPPGVPAPVATAPAEPDPATIPWAVGGFVDTQYVFNSNLPDNHVFRGTAVTARTGEFNPNLLVGYVRRDPIKSPWMFELALQFGSAPDALYAAEPIAGGPGGKYAGVEVFKHISKAWTGVKLKGGTEIAAGLMLAPTHFGSFWTKDNWHSSITWGYSSVPFFLSGVRVWQPITEKLGIGAWLTTGYGLMGDINKAPSGLINIVYAPVSGLQLIQNVYAGPEDVDMRPEYWRLLLDTQIVYVGKKWGMAVVGDYGRERLSKTGQPVAQWANGMVSVRWDVLERPKADFKWGMAVRPEFFWDHGGRIFGAQDLDNWLYGATFTNDFRLWDSLLLRLEYRNDNSSAPSGYWYRGAAVTDDAVGLASRQHTVIFNFIGYFERRVAGLKK